MSEFLTLHEIVKAARASLAQGEWDYLTGGAETETTLMRNRQGLDSLAFRPRVLNDVREIDCSGEVMGHKVRLPVSLAPMGSLQALHPGGAMEVARAAEEFGVVNILSSVTVPGMEEIGEATKHPKIFQLYVRGDRDTIAERVKAAVDYGYMAFCLTVDVAVYSRRERDIIKRYLPAGRRRARNADGFEFQAALSWDLVKWFKDSFDIPLLLKGIATAEDTERAVGLGVEGIYVSNHGGRQLDHGKATIDMLPEIVQAAGGKAEIIVDGGFMRGTDVCKAMALGADSVAIGKLQGFGLAADGQAGIVRVLEILETEIDITLGLLGVTSFDQLDPTYLDAVAPVVHASAFSAFPFLNFSEQEY